MTAAEIKEGLARLGVLHETTLPYTPAANGKIETLWASVEGRLIAMLEGVPDLTLAHLNEATLAWAEQDYNRRLHSEIGVTPITRFLAGPSVMRPSPDSGALRLAFTRTERRTQRKSDGTIVIDGRRFEVPDRYRHLGRLEVRYAGWDLSLVHLVDERIGTVLCRLFPQDKAQNASGPAQNARYLCKGASRYPTGGRRCGAASAEAPEAAVRYRAASGLPPER
jgi:hypothetical protein